MIKPPKYLADVLRRTFPHVELVWWKKGRKWALVEKFGPSRIRPIRLLEGHPTIKNTVAFLREASVAHLQTKWDRQLWQKEKLDAPMERAQAEREARRKEAVEEAARRMVTLIHPKVVMIKRWGGKHATQRGHRRPSG